MAMRDALRRAILSGRTTFPRAKDWGFTNSRPAHVTVSAHSF